METNVSSDYQDMIADLIRKDSGHKRDRIVVIGRRSSGKTVYLSLLYEKLWKNQSPVKVKALRGANHIEYIKTADDIRKGIWPAATQGISQTYLEISYKERDRLMVALDYPGEVFTNAFIKNTDSDEVRTLLDHIDHAQAVILLVDPNHTIKGDVYSKTDNDYGLLEAINRIHNWPEGKDIPIVLVLTKADDNAKVLEKHGGLKTFIHKHYSNLIAKTKHLKVCMISALREIGAVNINGRHLTSFDTPLLYCIERIEINDAKQRDIRKKEEIEKLCESIDIKSRKTAFKKEIIWFLLFCVLLAMLIFFEILYLPSTVWHNLWANTLGCFF